MYLFLYVQWYISISYHLYQCIQSTGENTELLNKYILRTARNIWERILLTTSGVPIIILLKVEQVALESKHIEFIGFQ